jgi:hypothetical protein
VGGELSNIRYRLSPELYLNVREKKESLGGLLLWQASRITSLAFVYGSAKYDIGEAEIEGVSLTDSLDRRESLIDLFAYYQPTTMVRFSVDGQYGVYEFTNQEYGVRDSRSYGIFGGIDLIPKIGEQLAAAGMEGRIRLGYQRLDFIDAASKDGSGFTGEADVSMTLGKKNSVGAFFSHGFEFSVYSGSSFFLSTSIGGGISRLLSRKATLSYNITYSTNSYPEGEPSAGSLNSYISHTFGLNFRLGRLTNLGIVADLGKRTLDSSGQTTTRNFFGFNLSYGSTAGAASAPAATMGR